VRLPEDPRRHTPYQIEVENMQQLDEAAHRGVQTVLLGTTSRWWICVTDADGLRATARMAETGASAACGLENVALVAGY